MNGFLTAQAFDIEKLANFGVPAALLFYFIIYSARIYQQLSEAITRQGEMLNQTIAAVVERFDRALERHEAMVTNIASTTASLTSEIARTSTAIQGAVQSMAEMVKSVAEADRKSHDDARELMIRLQSRYMGDER